MGSRSFNFNPHVPVRYNRFTMKMKKAFLWLATMKIALLLTGCGPSPEANVKQLYRPSTDKNVTSSPEYNFSSFVGTIWKTKTKTAVADLKRYTGAHETKLLAPDAFDSTHPKYNPPANMQIIAVLPPG